MDLHHITVIAGSRLNFKRERTRAFFIMEGAKQIGEMVFSALDQNLANYHTEVAT
jgi:hypothetical protein